MKATRQTLLCVVVLASMFSSIISCGNGSGGGASNNGQNNSENTTIPTLTNNPNPMTTAPMSDPCSAQDIEEFITALSGTISTIAVDVNAANGNPTSNTSFTNGQQYNMVLDFPRLTYPTSQGNVDFDLSASGVVFNISHFSDGSINAIFVITREHNIFAGIQQACTGSHSLYFVYSDTVNLSSPAFYWRLDKI